MTLKPRIVNHFALMILGAIFAMIAALVWRETFPIFSWQVDGYPVLFATLLGLLGAFMIRAAMLSILRRSQRAVVIDEGGIELPAFNPVQGKSDRLRIRREGILKISKHETIKGRQIEITTTSGDNLVVQARNYCDLNVFIDHCRRHGLPVS